MTLTELEERLHEAITTLAALPDNERRFLRAKMVAWPETLREAADIWEQGLARVRQGKAAFEAMREPRAVPPPAAIDRMDEALRWLAWLTERERKILILRAFGLSFERISWRFRGKRGSKISDESVRRWYVQALAVIHARLTRKNLVAIGAAAC